LFFSKLIIALVAIDHQMARIEVQVRKNFVENVFIDGDSKINIVTKE